MRVPYSFKLSKLPRDFLIHIPDLHNTREWSCTVTDLVECSGHSGAHLMAGVSDEGGDGGVEGGAVGRGTPSEGHHTGKVVRTLLTTFCLIFPAPHLRHQVWHLREIMCNKAI